MKKLIKILAIVIIAVAIYSFIPVALLYLDNDPVPYTNNQAADKLRANEGEFFEFIVTGDCHSGLVLDDSAAIKSIRNMNREKRFQKAPIDFVEISGDVSFRGSAWDYRIFNRIRSLIRMPVICAMGNHDDDKDNGELFRKYAGADEFSFTDRNSYFITVNNGSNDLSEQQFLYLEDELKKSAAYSHRFVFLHKSPTSYQQAWYRPELSPWAYRFMKLCEKYKVDIVFSGHEHMFKKCSFGGVQYVTSGGGGIIPHTPKHDGGFLHYIVVMVNGDYVDYEVRKIFPPFWEFLTYYMWKDIFYFLKGVFV
jgi:predicted phosphodiesterase